MYAIELMGVEKHFAKSDYRLSLPEMRIPEGYVTGFIGENGAGKTTVIKLLMNMLFLDAGTATIFGRPVSDVTLRDEIGYVGEYMGFGDELRLDCILKMLRPFYSHWDEALLQKLLKRFGLTNLRQKHKALSQGKKRQFALATVLSRRPKLLLLDEPTANLDPLVRFEILEMLSDQLAQGDVTVFFSTHITSDLDKIADYLQFLHGGRLILQGDKDSLLEKHCIVKGGPQLLTEETKQLFVYSDVNAFGFSGLCDDAKSAQEIFGMEAVYERPRVEDLFLGYTRRERGDFE